MKTAFLFSGQGAQYPGMGKDLYETYEEAKYIFDHMVLDFDIKKLCFEGPAEQLNDTKYAQACIFLHSMVCSTLLKQHGIEPDVCAGLSLGEYSALCYANAFSINDGVKIVGERGNLMATALPQGTSAMSAVLLLDKEHILQACSDVKAIGICEIANYNCPGQIVITGEKDAVLAAGEKCVEYGARRVIPLQVSGAFHSSLLTDAANELRLVLQQYDLKKPELPVYNNISGTVEQGDLVDILSKQIAHSVYFEQTIQHMVEDGVTTFIEVGPGKTVSGFVKKCCKGMDVTILNVENVESLKSCIEALKG